MLIIKGYTVIESLYVGTRYNVYKGRRESDQLKVVFKACRNENPSLHDIAALQHEYKILNELQKSPTSGIIQVHDLIKQQRQLTLIIEDFDGEPLRNYLAQRPLPITEFLSLALQITDALHNIHLNHVTHKDINPYNILINPKNKQIKIVDFGLSSFLSEESQNNFEVNKLEGTLAYLSPEQTGRMNCPVDFHADLYSLGITFYEMLTGELPFYGEDAVEWIHLHLVKIPALASTINHQVPQQIALLVAKLITKNPEERYASALGIKNDLLKCQKQWLQEHKVDSFILGENDINDTLKISRKLYGRENSLAQLLQGFDQVAKGSSGVCLVSGYSGIGKSSLINELYKPIAENQGYFTSGKFEQFHQDVPYAALLQALKKLLRQILSEPQHKINKFRDLCLQKLSTNAQIIIDVLPELALVIGEHPVPLELSAQQVRLRFEETFRNFVSCFAGSEHPLVLFLDDLQWADSATLDLLFLILKDKSIENFLLLGAYRDNEVTPTHQLFDVMHKLKKLSVTVQTIKLEPLELANVENLLFDTLKKAEHLSELAILVLNKTGGNPFFITTFLNTLYQEKLLYFNREVNCWEWKIEVINQLAITNNVVDLLLKKIERLQPKTQNLLKIAACIGTNFELKTLSVYQKSSQTEIATILWEALENHLLIPGEDYKLIMADSDFENQDQVITYKFSHDRVQQAAYSMLSEAEKKRTHLDLGRILSTGSELDVFSVVNHFNYSLELLETTEEKYLVANLNVRAGKKAKSSTAYEPALLYFQYAIEISGQEIWDKYYDLAFAMHIAFAECQHLLGNYSEADENFSQILKHAKTKIHKAQISMHQVLSYTIQVKFDAAIAAGLYGLEVLGMKLSRNPSTFRVVYELFKTMWALRKTTPEEIYELPTVNNEEQKLLIELVERLGIACFIDAPNFLAISTLKTIRYCLQHGNTASAATFYIMYAVMQIVAFKKIDYAYKLAELSIKLADKYQDPRVQMVCYFTDSSIPFHWKLSYEAFFPYLTKSFSIAQQIGDLVYTNYNISVIPLIMLFKGDELNEVEFKVKNMKLIADFTRNIDGLSNLGTFIRVINILKGDSGLSELDQLVDDFVTGKIVHGANVAYANTGTLIMLACCVMESWHNAAKMFKKNCEYKDLQPLQPVFINTEFTFYMAIAALNLVNSTSEVKVSSSDLRQYTKWIKIAIKRFALWSKHCPQNYLAKYLILTAGQLELTGDYKKALLDYNKAIVSARDNNLIHIEAIIFQQIVYGFSTFQETHSKYYLTEERYSYIQWGAIGKSKQLENQYPNLFTDDTDSKSFKHKTLTTEIPVANIDLLSIIKFTQAISSEIQLDKLLQTLLRVLLQAAGAERCVLLRRNANDNWIIDAESTGDKEYINLNQLVSIEDRVDLPHKLIQYVYRTNQSISFTAGKSSTSEQIAVDKEYLDKANPKSVLVMPIIYQGQLRSILYFENRTSTSAFSKDHIQTLKLLTSQAAISLENARLYYQATHDPLTGLANRNLLYQIFNFATVSSKIRKSSIAILFLDLDGFKKINDTLGHEVGDKLLQNFSERLKGVIKPTDLAVRLGGDEFVALIENFNDISEVGNMAKKLLEDLNEPAQISQHKIKINSSMGISIYPENGENINDLLKKADIALYQVKAQGKGDYKFYSAKFNQDLVLKNQRELELRQALEDKHLSVYYQPIYNAKTQQPTHFEALVRWHHPDKKLIAAKDFIEVAEKSGLIVQIGDFVVNEVMSFLKDNIEAGYAPLPIAINISSTQFRHRSISEYIQNLLQTYQLDASLIEVELTENIFIDQADKIMRDINNLNQMGLALTIDDFGTYYSSLIYLKRFAVNSIKIDQMFVRDLEDNEENRALVRTIIGMAKSLKLKVVAEGVETKTQMEFLISEGADELQGFYLSHPVNKEDACKFLVLKKSDK